MKERVLLDFWAEWCGPCKMMNPVIDELEKEYPDLKIVKFVIGAMPKPRFIKELGL
jgi:thioredoxin 1